jgi:hypothetical protein
MVSGICKKVAGISAFSGTLAVNQPAPARMLQKLAGRLKWERVNDGIRVVIPGRLTPKAAFYAVANRFVLLAATYLLGIGAAWLLHLFEKRPMDWWLAPALCVGLLTAFLTSPLERITLSLYPNVMTIMRGPTWAKGKYKNFLTEGLYNMRYVTPGPGADIRNENRQAEIQFEQYCQTQSFAAGISADEASALIALMMSVYAFPAEEPQPSPIRTFP